MFGMSNLEETERVGMCRNPQWNFLGCGGLAVLPRCHPVLGLPGGVRCRVALACDVSFPHPTPCTPPSHPRTHPPAPAPHAPLLLLLLQLAVQRNMTFTEGLVPRFDLMLLGMGAGG